MHKFEVPYITLLYFSVELACHVVAFPRPTITWISPKKNQLTTNLNYVVDNGYVTADDHTETSVRIKRLGRQHLGKYICRAQNKLGLKEQVNKLLQICCRGDINLYQTNMQNLNV